MFACFIKNLGLSKKMFYIFRICRLYFFYFDFSKFDRTIFLLSLSLSLSFRTNYLGYFHFNHPNRPARKQFLTPLLNSKKKQQKNNNLNTSSIA